MAMERRGQMQSFEVDENLSLVEDSPVKRHPRQSGNQTWANGHGSSGVLGGYFPDLLLQCFGTSSRESFAELEQKSLDNESRIAQLSETLRQERELRAGDLSAFDAQIDQFREEKEMALRDLEDLRNTHKGTLQRLEAVEERSEKLSGDVRHLDEEVKTSRDETVRWKRKANEMENSLLEAAHNQEALKMSHQAEVESLEAQVQSGSEQQADLRKQITNLADRLEQTKSERDFALHDLEHQSRQLVNLSSEHEAMIKRQGELKEELITKEKLYADAAQQIEKLKEDCENVQTSLQSAEEKISSQEAQRQANLSEIEQLQDTCANLEAKFKEREKDLENSEQEAQAKLTLIESLESQAKKQENELKGALKQSRDLRDQKNRSQKELSTALLQVDSVNAALKTLESNLQQSETSCQNEREKVLEFQGKYDEAQVLSQDMKKQIGDLKKRIKDLESEKTQISQEVESLSLAYNEEHQAKAQIQGRNKGFEREIAECKEVISKQRNEIEEMGAQIEAYEEELFQLRNHTQRFEPHKDKDELMNGFTNSLKSEETSYNERSILNSSQNQQDCNGQFPNSHSDDKPYDGNNLSGVFKDRKEWQDISSEGKSQGWLLNPDEVVREQVIGKGSFGETWLGLHDGETVAIKCVRVSREIEAKIFLRELKALTRVRHANLMPFKGAVLDPPQSCWLIVEYLPGGTLSDWLYGKEGRGAPRRSLQEKVNMGVGIAKGMLALEATDPPIMHRDLKPTNILLDGSGNPKISDFGLCREHLEDEAYNYTGETGSYTYMSPEMMRGEMYGPSTDVYSYAILLAEILRQRPSFEEFYLSPVQVAEGVAYQDIRPSIPRDVPSGLKYLIEACWCPEPEGRPDFSTITGHLLDISQKIPTKRGFFS